MKPKFVALFLLVGIQQYVFFNSHFQINKEQVVNIIKKYQAFQQIAAVLASRTPCRMMI